MSSPLAELRARLFDVNALHSAAGIMQWDQQTYMPPGGAPARAEHLGILSRMAHERFVDDSVGTLIERAGADAASEDDRALVKRTKRNYDIAAKLPAEFVAERTRLAAVAHEEWVAARANNDFASFAPTLERMFETARREAAYLGYADHMYDALLDLYEEGATAADARAMFDALKGPQTELVREIAARPQPDDAALYGEWDRAKERNFTETIVQAIGFDMSRGRQDVAPHPFCTGWSVGDIRLTTRYLPYLGSAIFGSLHEAGHGMYEQGSPMAWDRTPLAGGVSLGVHESQSRLWENIVGRSRAFWSHFLPKLQSIFPSVAALDLDGFYRAVNRVRPSLIRVEADELTYNLHVLIRFELECDLLVGDLAIKDLPEAWGAKYEQYLGIRPETDANGCLQDVHWSQGSIGYFPTYSMGNLLSYQIWNALKRELPDPDALIAKGEFAPIHEWLRDRLYRLGSKYTPKETVLKATGKPIDPSDYLEGLGAKYRELYGVH